MKSITMKVYKAIHNPRKVALYLFEHFPSQMFSDRLYISIVYWLRLGKKLNLDSPVTFSEKLQWLKLHNRNPEYTVMVDKYRVREYIAEKLGEEYLIPLLGVWDDPDDIDFDALPNQFVLKCNHNSGLGMCICKDKSKLNIQKVKADLRKGLRQDYYLTGREWPYKNVPKKIIAEKYMDDGTGSDLRDYKFFCFGGKPQYCQVISNRSTKETIDFFDTEWNHQEFTGLSSFLQFSEEIKQPQSYKEMQGLAGKLSQRIPFVRIDFYEIKGKPYFGEITFYPASGFGVFTPNKWNVILGKQIELPLEMKD